MEQTSTHPKHSERRKRHSWFRERYARRPALATLSLLKEFGTYFLIGLLDPGPPTVRHREDD